MKLHKVLEEAARKTKRMEKKARANEKISSKCSESGSEKTARWSSGAVCGKETSGLSVQESKTCGSMC